MEEALADRADDALTHLALKLTDFITYVMKQAFPLFLADCEPIQDTLLDIQDTLLQRFGDMYNHSELQLHKKIWDAVNHDSTRFVDWCRRIALHRTESIAANNAATEHADIAANNAATEHADPFRIMVKDIFANDLTPELKNVSKYKLREGASITTEQRSLVNVILRKNLGDARVATYILKHGVPTLLDPPSFRSTLPRTKMDSMLEEFLEWHASLLKWLSNLQNDPNTIVAQKLSDLNQKEWQAERRREKSDTEQQLRQGALLANLRDTHAKRFHDMSATEQRVLEDYETGKLRKRLDEVRIRKPNQQAPPDHPA